MDGGEHDKDRGEVQVQHLVGGGKHGQGCGEVKVQLPVGGGICGQGCGEVPVKHSAGGGEPCNDKDKLVRAALVKYSLIQNMSRKDRSNQGEASKGDYPVPDMKGISEDEVNKAMSEVEDNIEQPMHSKGVREEVKQVQHVRPVVRQAHAQLPVGGCGQSQRGALAEGHKSVLGVEYDRNHLTRNRNRYQEVLNLLNQEPKPVPRS